MRRDLKYKDDRGGTSLKKERKIAFNTHLIIIFALFLIFIGLAIFFMTDSEDGDIAF